MPTYRINIHTNAAGAISGLSIVEARMKGVADKTDKANNNIKKLGQGATRLESAFRRTFDLLALGFAVQQIAALSDSMTLLKNRLGTVIGAGESTNAIIGDLYRTAQTTRTSFEGLGQVYTRLRLATKSMGLAHGEALRFVELLSKAVTLSGASSVEASNALIQLSQGLAAGTLRGDELRSVIEQLPGVAAIIAKEFGVTAGQLRVMGEQGLITADQIYEAFKNSADEIDAAYRNTIPTIGQSFTMLQNAISYTVFNINEANGIFSAFAAIIAFVANNITLFVAALAPILLGAVYAGFAALATIIRQTAFAQTFLNSAVLASPLLRLAGYVLGIVAAIVNFRDSLASGAAQLLSWLGFFDSFEKAAEAVKFVLDRVIVVIYKLIDNVITLFGLVKRETPKITEEMKLFNSESDNSADSFKQSKTEVDKFSNSVYYAGNVGRSSFSEISSGAVSAGTAIAGATVNMRDFSSSIYEASYAMKGLADARGSYNEKGFDGSFLTTEFGKTSGGTFSAPEGLEVKAAGVGTYGTNITFKPTDASLKEVASFLAGSGSTDTATRLGAYQSLQSDLGLANALAASLPGSGSTSRDAGTSLQNAAAAYVSQLTDQLARENADKAAKEKAAAAAKKEKENKSKTVNNNVTIVTPDANSFAQNQSQLNMKFLANLGG